MTKVAEREAFDAAHPTNYVTERRSDHPKPKNLMGKTVKETAPYEVWMSSDGTWVWLVLKKYQADDYKPFARAFCAVTSPLIYGGSELGDTYLAEIRKNALKVEPGIRAISLNIGRGTGPVEISLAAAVKVVGHPLTITEVGA